MRTLNRALENGEFAVKWHGLDRSRLRRQPQALVDFPARLLFHLTGINWTSRRPPSPKVTALEGTIIHVVEDLHMGGMERALKSWTAFARADGLDAPVLCTRALGSVAEELKKDGVRVELVSGGAVRWRARFTRRRRPFLVHTHGAARVAAASPGGSPGRPASSITCTGRSVSAQAAAFRTPGLAATSTLPARRPSRRIFGCRRDSPRVGL